MKRLVVLRKSTWSLAVAAGLGGGIAQGQVYPAPQGPGPLTDTPLPPWQRTASPQSIGIPRPLPQRAYGVPASLSPLDRGMIEPGQPAYTPRPAPQIQPSPQVGPSPFPMASPQGRPSPQGGAGTSGTGGYGPGGGPVTGGDGMPGGTGAGAGSGSGAPPAGGEAPGAPGSPDDLASAPAPTPIDFASTEGSGGTNFASGPIIGDRSTIMGIYRPGPRQPTPNPPSQPIVARTGIQKISDNQYPVPVTRFFFSYDFFNNVNAPFNKQLGLNIDRVQLNHYMFGYEQAFFDNQASIGIRLPYNVLTFRNTANTNAFQNVNTDSLGNLSVYGKMLLWSTADKTNLISAGLLVEAPTGPRKFAGSDIYQLNQTTYVDPFIGYRFQPTDRAYMLGFTSMDIPTNGVGPVYLFNDLQFGYYLHKAEQPGQFLSAVVPLFEVHVNTPLSNRGFSPSRPFFGIDVVNIMAGTHVVLADRFVISWAAGTPVTGPQPWNFETIVMLNIVLGGGRTPLPTTAGPTF